MKLPRVLKQTNSLLLRVLQVVFFRKSFATKLGVVAESERVIQPEVGA